MSMASRWCLPADGTSGTEALVGLHLNAANSRNLTFVRGALRSLLFRKR